MVFVNRAHIPAEGLPDDRPRGLTCVQGALDPGLLFGVRLSSF